MELRKQKHEKGRLFKVTCFFTTYNIDSTQSRVFGKGHRCAAMRLVLSSARMGVMELRHNLNLVDCLMAKKNPH